MNVQNELLYNNILLNNNTKRKNTKNSTQFSTVNNLLKFRPLGVIFTKHDYFILLLYYTYNLNWAVPFFQHYRKLT